MKNENILKRTMMLILVLTLVMNVLTGCSEASKVENELEVHQTKCDSEDFELGTECEDHEWEDETEHDHMDSTELETEMENETESNVEDATENNTTNKTESDKQTTNQSSTDKNNSTQNSSSNNSSSQTNKNQVGLGKDSYVYITNSSN